MCGIAGLAYAAGRRVEPALLDRITDSLAHRGPDDRGIWIDDSGSIGLGHRRLSIIDLSPLGRQPMHSPSGRYTMVYNGEIYNYATLRDELRALGAIFRGGSDTEVILAAFEAWGVRESLARLAGMFAIALWDSRERALWLIRDRLGIKPLYYAASRDALAFGSELRAVEGAIGRAGLSRTALARYMVLGCVPAPLSILEGVRTLEPGAFLIWRAGREPEAGRFWSLEAAARRGLAQRFRGGEDDAVEALDALLRQVVREHMLADVPLGALLSGGIDSSSVVGIMQASSRGPVHTYSIGFEEKSYDEAPQARVVAAHLRTAHTELYVSEREAREVIARLPMIHDEPFADSSQIPTYLVARLARGAVTVALSGDGGDEMFGGYNRYLFVERHWRALSRLPRPLRGAIAAALRTVPESGWQRALSPFAAFLPALPAQKLAKLARVLGARDVLDLHRTLVAQWPEPPPVLGAPDLPIAPLPLAGADDVSRQMVHDGASYMVDDVLTKVDRASMAVGLEVRPPLLDHRVVEFAWSLPIAWKVRDGVGKRVLRSVLARYVPPALTERPKMGFGVPIGAWLRGPLRDWAEALLDPARLRREGLLDAPAIERVWRAHLSGRVDRSGALWAVLMFEAWLDRRAGVAPPSR